MKIILVDDEPLFHKIFAMKYRQRIRQGEFNVESYEDGRACLEALRAKTEQDRNAILVVFSDINMPEMNGLEMLKELKQDFATIPVVMVSAYTNEDTKDFVQLLGGLDLIPKPVEFEQITDVIERLLDEKKRGLQSA